MSVELGQHELQAEAIRRLVKASQRGDTLSAERLVALLWDPVFSLCFRLSRNKPDAEDITQEAFLRAFKQIKEFDPEGNFKAWLMRIASNLYFDEQKSSRRKENHSIDPALLSGRIEGPEEQAAMNELSVRLWAAIRSLSKDQQVALVLRSIDQMEYAEIAQIMDVKEGTVRWHIHEARSALRTALQSDLGGENCE